MNQLNSHQAPQQLGEQDSLSLVITVFNERDHLPALLSALDAQTLVPREIIIVDAYSSDGTWQILEEWQQRWQARTLLAADNLTPNSVIKIIQQAGGISSGRNTGIGLATGSLIATTDAGCVPEPDWLVHLYQKALDTEADMVAGHAVGLASNAFEAAQVPFVLVPDHKIKRGNYLPATRSMLMKKTVWQELGGFDERLAVSEDYAFSIAARRVGYKIVFCQQARVGWQPRPNLWQFASMVAGQATYDIVGGIKRTQVDWLFWRWSVAALVLLITSLTQPVWLGYLVLLMTIGFVTMVVWRRGRGLSPASILWLPVLHLTSDLAVMAGTLRAYLGFTAKIKIAKNSA